MLALWPAAIHLRIVHELRRIVQAADKAKTEARRMMNGDTMANAHSRADQLKSDSNQMTGGTR